MTYAPDAEPAVAGASRFALEGGMSTEDRALRISFMHQVIDQYLKNESTQGVIDGYERSMLSDIYRAAHRYLTYIQQLHRTPVDVSADSMLPSTQLTIVDTEITSQS